MTRLIAPVLAVARSLPARARGLPARAWWTGAAAAGLALVMLAAGRDGAGALLLLLVGGALYMLPTAIAAIHHHRQTVAIGVLNALLGWTVVGWVAAMVWAATEPAPPPAPPVYAPPQLGRQDLAARLARLDQLAADGVISAAERAEQRRRLIQASVDAEQPHPH